MGFIVKLLDNSGWYAGKAFISSFVTIEGVVVGDKQSQELNQLRSKDLLRIERISCPVRCPIKVRALAIVRFAHQIKKDRHSISVSYLLWVMRARPTVSDISLRASSSS